MKAVALALALATTAGATVAQPTPVVTSAWSRPTAAGMTAAGYMTLANKGHKADALTAADTPVAQRVEFHRSSVANGVASMQKLDKVAVPPGGQVLFGPNGYHLMLVGLKQPLKVGDNAPITLTFASGARVRTNLKVAIAAP